MIPAIFLHGALGTAAQFDDLRAQLPKSRSDFAINLPGHGGSPVSEPFSLLLFERAILTFLDEKQIAQADFFGYSMGGYVALWFAWKHPARIRKLITYGTKLEWNPEVAASMNRMFDPEKIESKVPQLAASLASIHGDEQWKNLCHQTAEFLVALGNGHGIPPEAFAQIQCPVTIGWGDLDHLVTEAESRQVAEAIPKGGFKVLPGGKHLIEQVDGAELAHFAFAE